MNFQLAQKSLPKGTPIFPRLELEAEVAYIQKKMSEGTQTNEEQSNGIQKKPHCNERKPNQIRCISKKSN